MSVRVCAVCVSFASSFIFIICFVVICCLHFEFGVRLIFFVIHWFDIEFQQKKKLSCKVFLCFVFAYHPFILFYFFVCVYSLDASLIYTLRTKNNEIDFGFFAGLPISLSSTSNSLKSSGTFNSNSSINSTPSVDRYAALKDLDEQLREIKEKDNNNTLSSTTSTSSSASSSSSTSSSSAAAAAAANPFNVTSVQANPFQSTASPPWFSEQQQQQHTPQHHHQSNGGPATTMTNGFSGTQHIYAMTNGTTNGLYDQQQQHQQSAFALNGSMFNGNGMHSYQKVTDTNLFSGSFNMANGFPPKNPFAVSESLFLQLLGTRKILGNWWQNLIWKFVCFVRFLPLMSNSRLPYWMQPPIHFCESRQVNASKYKLKRQCSERMCMCVRITPGKSDGSSNDVNSILLNSNTSFMLQMFERKMKQTNPHQVIE